MELTPANAAERRAARHRGELGLTLAELLVSIAVLAIIGGSIGAAFSIGIKVLGSGGAQQRLSGSHDLLSFEQQLGADVARAQCLASPAAPQAGNGGPRSIPWSSGTSRGGCPLTVQKSTTSCTPSGYLLCLGWFVPGGACHTVTYWQATAGGTVVRRDVATNGVTTSDQITTTGLVVTATWPTPTVTTADSNSYLWVSQVNVTVTQQGASGAPHTAPANTTFHLVPLVADPMSPVLSGSPC